MTITGGEHTSFALASSNAGGILTPTTIYGDGANAGIAPNNICLDGPTLCANATRAFVSATNPGFAAGSYQNGSNGNYWGVGWPGSNPTGTPNTVSPAVLAQAATPNAQYSGTISYDTVTGSVTGGIIAWTGAYGFEVTVPVGSSVGGSFFSWAWLNGNINLATGTRTTTTAGANPNAICFLGAAGNVAVGNLLCGAANSPLGYNFSNGGAAAAYTPTYTALSATEGLLTLQSFRCTNTTVLNGSGGFQSCTGNDLYEQWHVQVVPVPAAVWLFGSALGLMGIAARRRKAVA